MLEYKGSVIEESLNDNRIINSFKVVGVRISEDENSADRWHIYSVTVNDEDIEILSKNIKEGWYMHFWNEKREVVAIFRDKKFEFLYDDKDTWKPAVDYGLSLGIPQEQLDFLLR